MLDAKEIHKLSAENCRKEFEKFNHELLKADILNNAEVGLYRISYQIKRYFEKYVPKTVIEHKASFLSYMYEIWEDGFYIEIDDDVLEVNWMFPPHSPDN